MPASTPRPELTALESVGLLEELQRQDIQRQRRTALAAWGSVGIATLVLGILIFGAWWSLQEVRLKLSEVTTEHRTATQELEDLKRNKEQLAEEIAELQAQKALLTQALGSVPQEARQAALEYQFDADPKAAELLPRVYVQIVDPNDRAWAKDMSRTLEKAGVIVAGIEYVPNAAGLRKTDVRYYKKSELRGAERIAAVLQAAGVDATTNYLNEETNTKVRPNHYEVWFAGGSRNTPLRKLDIPSPDRASSLRDRRIAPSPP